MNSTILVQPKEQAEPSLVVFGRDDAGKPRASWFDALSADLATKAADLMKMRILKVESDEQKAVARQLAPGRVFASGRAFTPFARATVFSQLVELAHLAQEAGVANAATGVAASAGNDARAAADGFGAPSSGGGAENGETRPAPEPDNSLPSQAAGSGSAQPSTTLPRARPEDWDEIGIGSLVLATVGVEAGWWESVVLGVNGDAFTLKWRDYPRDPVFVRRRTELALLPAAAQ